MAAPAAPVAAAVVEKSFLRHLIPLRVQGPGPMSPLLRHAFIHQECLLMRFFGALEQVELPSAPRMLLAEGMQRLLEGTWPQRDVRALFEEAEVECRRALLVDSSPNYARGYAGEDASRVNAIRIHPPSRLLAYELRGACEYYAQVTSISSTPTLGAASLLRTLIATDVRTDALLVNSMLRFDAFAGRDIYTGERVEGAAPMPTDVDAFIKEELLLERDCFGRFRFDPRGDNRHLMHTIKLEDTAKTQKSFSILLDPTVRAHGNFELVSEVVFNGRWTEHRIRCGKEDHRVCGEIPICETLTTADDISGAPLQMLVRYDEPICYTRRKETVKEGRGDVDHEEVFQLAAKERERGLLERWFMDR